MILIGQYDSPFVRRVGIALTLYGINFEHRPWSVFRDSDLIRPYNPLTRVPTLVLDDGEALVESHAMLDHLDSLVPAERALFPRGGLERRKALKVATLATGAGEKAVALFYEQRLHSDVSTLWVERCRAQVRDTFALLEAELGRRPGAAWFGERMGHADIAAACVLRFVTEAHPGLLDTAAIPALAALAARLEATAAFETIRQPFIPPA